MRNRLAVMALVMSACSREPQKPVFEGDAAAPRRAEDALDCRTHLAHADTGEVVAKSGPFAFTAIEGDTLALHEGDAVTWKLPLGDGGTKPIAAAILPHHVVASDGTRLVSFERKTGKLVWQKAARGKTLLALPGDLALLADGERATAFGAKKGNEVFRIDVAADAPYLADERLVVLAGPSTTTIVDPPLATGALAPSTSRAPSRPRYDLAVHALGVVTTRGALGDVLVVSEGRIERVRAEPHEGVPAWSEEVPFAGAKKLAVLDAEDTLVLAAYPGDERGEARVRVYDVKGDELRTRFDANVRRARDGRTGCTFVLGKPAKDLVVAEKCNEGSAVTIVGSERGNELRRADFPPPK